MTPACHVVVLAGGAGVRLRPLAGDVIPKQFIEVLPAPDGGSESMLARTCRMLAAAGAGTPLIVTGSSHEALAREQVPDANFCFEPCRRNTFAAVCLGAAQLSEAGTSADDVMVVLPADGYADESLYALVMQLATEALGEHKLACIGIAPSFPSDQFGYIVPKSAERVAVVERFCEKPSPELAAQLIAQGALWNAGIYAMHVGYALNWAEEQLGTSELNELLEAYEELEPASFDKTVAEHESDLIVARYEGSWHDLGTPEALIEALGSDGIAG